MYEIVQVQLREAGEVKNFLAHGMKFDVGERVIVETDRGLYKTLVLYTNALILMDDWCSRVTS